MDHPRTPAQGPSGPGSGADDITDAEPGLSGWLAEVEGRLTAIDARLAVLESSLRPAVAEEVKGATADLRRAMTELGRRLVQDLPHELARHRDAIVAELRPPPPPPPSPSPAEPEVDDTPVVVTSSTATAPEPAETPEAGGRRSPRRRRRHG